MSTEICPVSKRQWLLLREALKATVFGCSLLIAASPASGQDTAAPTSGATANLIRLLVKQRLIKPEEAQSLLQEAEQEAAQVRAAAAKSQSTTTTPPAGTLRIPFVPQIVKNQIRDEVKKEVIQQAKSENWAQPDAVPEWTKRIKISGDLRPRVEYDMFAGNNDNQIVDYQAFNANGPTDINLATNPGGVPVLNTTEDRLNRFSIRARLGVNAVITDGVLAGLRLASGGDNGPVSTTQLLGGGFGKKDIWLDQAFVSLEPTDWSAFTLGRMANPFFHSDLMWDPDLNFDGAIAAIDTKEHGEDGFDYFASAGLFPLEYIGSNYPNGSTIKFRDKQKWLWGNQAGVNWKEPDFELRFAASYYQFGGIQGQLSDPCTLYNKQDLFCDTDETHPAFMQKGNTLFLIRQIVLDPNNPGGTALPEFAGLAFNYRVANATTEFSVPLGSHYRFIFDFDFVHNLAYHATVACRYAPFALPVTNVNPNGSNFDACDGPKKYRATLASGGDGFYVSGTFGDPQPRKRWEWNITAGYKYLEPDAVPDAYTDSDFHLGGTNARGYVVSASLGLFDNTWITTRWLSASEVFGPPLAIDVIQFDLNAGF
jgi:hypothetical protein